MGKSIAQNAAIAIAKKKKAKKDGKPVTYKDGPYEHTTANPDKDHKRLLRKHQSAGNARLVKLYKGKLGMKTEAKVGAKDISKAYDAVSKINLVMLANIDKYKAAKAAGKDTKKYMDIARQLTAKRKKAEAEMERVITMLDRDAELVSEYGGSEFSKITALQNFLTVDLDKFERGLKESKHKSIYKKARKQFMKVVSDLAWEHHKMHEGK
tara:strand:- start:1377 stop:2006 length:630 start_codon:yes stop_codon:yes gene_type:complete